MTQHSPADWRVLAEEPGCRYIRIRGSRPGTRHKIANVLISETDDPSVVELEEARANARLIASAPVGLAAARDALIALESAHHVPGVHIARQKLRDFIFRATGDLP